MGESKLGLVRKLKKACESAVLPLEFGREGYGPKLPMGLYRLSREEAIVVHAKIRWALLICVHREPMGSLYL